MILHNQAAPGKLKDNHLVTPGLSRYGKNVLELIHFSKHQEDANPVYLRSVTLRLAFDCYQPGIVKHVNSLFSMAQGENYHQLLITFPLEVDVALLLSEMLPDMKATDFIAWSASSFNNAFAEIRKQLKDSIT